MSNDLMLIFLIAISLFVMQAVGGVFQIKNYKAAIRRVHKKGNVGIGQKKGRFFKGNIAVSYTHLDVYKRQAPRIWMRNTMHNVG